VLLKSRRLIDASLIVRVRQGDAAFWAMLKLHPTAIFETRGSPSGPQTLYKLFRNWKSGLNLIILA